MQTIRKIYLHWSATGYSWAEPGHYHSVIDGEGNCRRLTDYHTALHQATYARNSDSVSIAVAAMATVNGGYLWPTKAQLDGLAKEAAKVAVGLKWPADPVKLANLIMTHAEAAANRDYSKAIVKEFSGRNPSSDYDHDAQDAGLPHANYGPSRWHDGWPGGDSYRWDLWQLRPGDAGGTGGFELRKMIAAWMVKIQAQTVKAKE